MLPGLVKTRQVIAVEQQGHGHTADIDHPFTIEQMADDTVALLAQIGIEQADFFGYSNGGALALWITIEHPGLVRKLVIATPGYNRDGFHLGVLEGIGDLRPEHLIGTPLARGIRKDRAKSR